MKYCSEVDVVSFFSLLNKADIQYILLRNMNDELPKNLPKNKDIDLLVKEEEAPKLCDLLKRNGWKQKPHPLRGYPFLYGMKPFEFYCKNGINLDICYQLACRSLNKGEWFPLDMMIQEDSWKNRREIQNKPWKYQLSVEDEFIHLITRCVFDKKEFNKDYIKRIEDLIKVIDHNRVLAKFEVVFFRYSERLLEQISEREYTNIIINYLQFKDY